MTPFDTERPRVEALPLHAGGGWLGVPLSTFRDLRGRVVLLHFWSASSVGSARAVEELRGLERRFADVLTVIGVHSPRFAHERRPQVVRDAVARLRLQHPVLDDYELVNWDAYAIDSVPTVVLLDHQGRVVGDAEGCGHAGELADAIERLVGEAEQEGALEREPLAATGLLDEDLDMSPLAGDGELTFPAGVAADVHADGVRRIAIADTGRDRVLLCRPDGQLTEVLDGYYRPQGLRFDGPDALLVCEPCADRVWRVDLASGDRRLVTDRVLSPADVVRWHGRLVVAGAAQHVLIAVDEDGATELLAGDGSEGLRDGAAPTGTSLAQPSALAVTSDGELAFLDAQSSSLRVLDRPGGTVRTLVGIDPERGGERDGDRAAAGLQHPLGLAAVGDELLIADTYNGRLRVWRDGLLTTVPLATFVEPVALAALPGGFVLVADRARHCVAALHVGEARVVTWDVGRPGPQSPAPLLAPTAILSIGSELEVELDLDLDGDELDPTGGPPVHVRVTAAAEWILGEEREWWYDDLPVQVSVPLRRGAGRIIVELRVACRHGGLTRERRTARAVDVVLT